MYTNNYILSTLIASTLGFWFIDGFLLRTFTFQYLLDAKDDTEPSRLKAESNILETLPFGIISFIIDLIFLEFVFYSSWFIKWESTNSFWFLSFLSKICVGRFRNFEGIHGFQHNILFVSIDILVGRLFLHKIINTFRFNDSDINIHARPGQGAWLSHP